jgi:DNA-binding Xre family transcriptional regulator
VIQLRVREVAERRGVTTIKALAEVASLAYDTASDLWHGRMQRVDRAVLFRVCHALYCTPGDLLTMPAEDEHAGNHNAELALTA